MENSSKPYIPRRGGAELQYRGISMKVTARNWQADAGTARYQATLREQDGRQTAAEAMETESTQTEPIGLEAGADFDTLLSSLDTTDFDFWKFPETNGSQSSSASGGPIKSSAPDDSVGQLAGQLAHAETKVDVLQVSSKAMRALVNLKMSLANADKKDQKKISRMIQRMEKLMKRIQKKLKHLNKEEVLERERERAAKKMEQQKEEEIRKELSARRKKRKRDERNYASKEMEEDRKNATAETMSAMGSSLPGASAGTVAGAASAGTAAATGSTPAVSAAGSAPAVSADAGAMAAESVSIDISV